MDHTQDWRYLTGFVAPGAEDGTTIATIDQPGAGGANHAYAVCLPNGSSIDIGFQQGGIKENGVNGVQSEHLIAIVLDRLRSFQKGPFPCRENALAITKLEEAQMWLHSRTVERLRRGVEGRVKA